MAIKEYSSQEEMDDDFEDCMERIQKEAYLKDAICRAEEEVAAAHDALHNAEEELSDLRQQLEDLGV